MAAVDFQMGDDYEDGPEDPTLEEMSIDDSLWPLDKLSHYVRSDLMLHRLYVVKGLSDTVETVGVAQSIDHVLPIMEDLCSDPEPIIRTSLIEQLPKIGAYFIQNGGEDGYSHAKTSLFSIFAHLLCDSSDQVRDLAQKTVVPMLQLLRPDDRESVLCPVLNDMAKDGAEEESKVDVLKIVAETAHLLGSGCCVRFAVPLLQRLAQDQMFIVRKACALTFGPVCDMVGTDVTMDQLLGYFLTLCEDEIWGVRRDCAKSLARVSENVAWQTRTTVLTPLFTKMAVDPSRWVRADAFKQLGHFIYTFAPKDERQPSEITQAVPESCQLDRLAGQLDQMSLETAFMPPIPGQSTVQDAGNSNNDNGIHGPIIGTLSGQALLSDEPEMPSGVAIGQKSREIPNDDSVQAKGLATSTEHGDGECAAGKDAAIVDRQANESTGNVLDSNNVEQDTNTQTDERVQTTEVDYDRQLIEAEGKVPQAKAETTAETDSDKVEQEIDAEMPDAIPGAHASETETNAQPQQTESDSNNLNSEPDSFSQSTETHTTDSNTSLSPSESCTSTVTQAVGTDGDMDINSMVIEKAKDSLGETQRANGFSAPETPSLAEMPKENLDELGEGDVPEALVYLYKLMLAPQSPKNIDSDVVVHCAYSFPGVLLALGQSQWDNLRGMYMDMVNDMQWKVRRSLACSLHEVAQLLGSSLATRDLLTVFNGFVQDLDEVKAGAVKHCASFLRLVSEEGRLPYLENPAILARFENPNNWRLRAALAKQLTALSQMYKATTPTTVLIDVTLTLSLDNVACVRENSFVLLSAIIEQAKILGRDDTITHALQEVEAKLMPPKPSHVRQIFIRMCFYLSRAIGPELFNQRFMPALTKLRLDNVPNVRMSLGRLLSHMAATEEYCANEDVAQALEALRADPVEDVRQCANGLLPFLGTDDICASV